MNCVYWSYIAHLIYFSLEATSLDWFLYRVLKRFTHCSDEVVPVFGGVVPFIVRSLACLHNCDVAIEHTVWEKGHYVAASENYEQKIISQITDYGELVSGITLAPAIYLGLDAQHAVFSEKVPKSGLPVMALQLVRRET